MLYHAYQLSSKDWLLMCNGSRLANSSLCIPVASWSTPVTCEVTWITSPWLHKHQIFVIAEKSQFHIYQVSFLNYVISIEGWWWMKARSLQSGSIPLLAKKLQCFLGFANFYRRFIKGFSLIAASLTETQVMDCGGRQSGCQHNKLFHSKIL